MGKRELKLPGSSENLVQVFQSVSLLGANSVFWSVSLLGLALGLVLRKHP